MKYYLDITLLPDAEASLGFLWQKIYSQLHIALADIKNTNGESDIAVSFPEYGSKSFPLGSKLRLFAKSQEKLQQLDLAKWLNRLTDYCHWTSIKEVPQQANKFAYFKRVQFKSNVERMARRRAKWKGESFEQAMKHFAGFKEQESKLPYVNMNSLSEKQRFRLFIEKEESTTEKTGAFNCYGLSKTATVPWF